MDLTVTLDSRYLLAKDGSVWSQAGMARPFWERYLEVFDRVRVVARAVNIDTPPDNWHEVTGPNILFVPIPDFCGPWEYVIRYPKLRKAIREAVPERGAVIMRVGSQIANDFEARLLEKSQPYALEVIGDPHDVFAPGVVEHPLRSFFRWHFSRNLRRQCEKAIAVAYVTRKALQTRYPTLARSTSVSDVDLNGEALLDTHRSTHYSSIELDEQAIVTVNRKARRSGPFRLVSIGSMAQMYKGFDIWIDSLAMLRRNGFDVYATIVGDGKYRAQLEAHAKEKGIREFIHFTGQLASGEPVRSILDSCDAFVLPSRTEGLPRALLEAMARALPCLATKVGGIPELLEDSELATPGDAVDLARKMQELLSSPERMEVLSSKNRALAMEYRDEILRERRRQFYEYVRETTQDWELHKRQ